MARSRNLKPGFFTNELLGAGDPLAQLLFAGLWCHADATGTLEDRPQRIKGEVFPHRPADVDALLDQLAAQGFIVRYQAAGRRLLYVLTFLDHQKPHHSERAKGFPPPTELQARTNPEELRCSPPSSLNPSSLNEESLVCSELPEAGSSEPTPDRAELLGPSKPAVPGEASPCTCAADAVVLTFPVVGGKGGQGPAEWPLRQSKIAEYQQTFPALDILRHCRVARQWCIDNPAKRKTARGMPAFLTRWLAREQDRGNGQPVVRLDTPEQRAQHVAQQRAQAERDRLQAEERRRHLQTPEGQAEIEALREQARKNGLLPRKEPPRSRNGPQGLKDA